MTWWTGSDEEDVHLWPLGNLIGPTPGTRPGDHFVVAIAGPAANLLMVMICSIILTFMNAKMILNPFGNMEGAGGHDCWGHGGRVQYPRMVDRLVRISEHRAVYWPT